MNTSNKNALQFAQSIIDTAHEAFIILDEKMFVVSANSSFYKKFRVSEEKSVGELIYRLDNGQWDFPQLHQLLENVIPSQKSFHNIEVKHPFKKSGEKVLLLNASSLEDGEGKAALILLAIKDITQFVETSRKLDESSATLDAVLQFIPEGLMITDENCRIQAVSSYTGDLFGVPVEELMYSDENARLKMLHLYWPDGEREIKPDELPLSKAAFTGKRYEDYDVLQKIDGTTKVFSANAAPIIDKNGKIKGAIGAWRDITGQRARVSEILDRKRVLDAILEYVPVGIMLVDRNGVITDVSRQQEEFLGLSQSEILGQMEQLQQWGVLDPSTNKTPDYESMPLSRAMVEKRVITDKEYLLVRDGKERVLALTAGPVMDSSGNVSGGVALWRDITSYVVARRETEIAQDEAQRRRAEVEAVLNSLPDGYIIYDREGAISKINDLARKILGVTEKNSRLSYIERMHELKPLTSRGQEFTVDQLPSHLALHGETVRNTVMKIVRSGEDFWLSVSASPIKADGRMLGVIMEFSDITALHSLQEQLTSEKNFVNAILQTSGALIVVFNSNGQIVRFNRACELLSGYAAEEVMGRTFFDLFVPHDEWKGVEEVVSRLYAGEIMVEHENHWLTKSGEKRYIRWRNSIMRDDSGQVTFAIATGIDISDRKHLEEELNKRAQDLVNVNKDLESFSYSVSHDLRGPLSTVGGFTTILLEDYSQRLDNEGRDYLSRINSSVKKMQHLIHDLLNLSRVGRQEVKREHVNMSTLISAYLQELKKEQPQRKIELIVEQNVYTWADQRLVQVALENLLRNAFKFTAKKDVARIEFGSFLREGRAVFFVRDNGVGFDVKFARTIFEPFKRVHAEKEFAGTGIGLSIVKRVVDRHGGKVWAEGEIGKGAVFYFTLGN